MIYIDILTVLFFICPSPNDGVMVQSTHFLQISHTFSSSVETISGKEELMYSDV